MESDLTRKLKHRRPLSDCTNTFSSSSSSVSLKPTKPNPPPPSAFNKPPTKRASATDTAANLDAASNPSSPPPTILSTPSLKTSSLHGTVDVDVEASEPISIVYSRRRSSNKRKDKGKEVAIPVSSTPSRRRSSNKRKDKGKEVAIPVSSTPILKVSNSRKYRENDGVEGVNLPKAKAMTVPCRKKPRAVSSKQDAFKDPLLQDFVEKQKAYFKMIDEFELPEEEVESIAELD